MSDERRAFQRLNLTQPDDGAFGGVPLRIVEVSARGVLALTDAPLQPGARGVVRFRWRGQSVEAGAAVVWCEEGRAGFRLDEVPELLRHLLEESVTELLKAQKTEGSAPNIVDDARFPRRRRLRHLHPRRRRLDAPHLATPRPAVERLHHHAVRTARAHRAPLPHLRARRRRDAPPHAPLRGAERHSPATDPMSTAGTTLPLSARVVPRSRIARPFAPIIDVSTPEPCAGAGCATSSPPSAMTRTRK